MKRTLIRAIALMLVLATFVTCAFVGCATAGGGTTETTETSGGSTDIETGGSTDVISKIFPFVETEVKKQDYSAINNGKITILYQGPDDPLYSHEVHISDGDKNGDKVDYEIYRRNLSAEEYFNIKFEYEPASGSAHGYEVMNKVNAAVGSGDNTYQIVVNSHGGDYTPPAMEGGKFVNLKNIPNLDLSKDYWAHFVNDNAEVSGALFGVTGSISLVLYQELYVCFFNRNLCRTKGIQPDALYDAVNDGKWTLDYMINLTRDIYDDVGGNGRGLEDVYGYGMVFATLDTVWSACDIRIAATNAKGELKLDVDLNKLSSVLSTLNDFVWNSKGVIRLDNEDVIQDAASKEIFSGGGAKMVATDHVLFANDRLGSVSSTEMKDCDHYGVLPYPKYNQRQTRYYSGARDHYTVFMVPFPAKEMADVCGAVLEYLAYYSHNNVMPKYYEEVLTGRYVRDPDSVEMLNTIFQNVKMDAGYIFGVGLLPLKLLRNMVVAENSSLTSVYRNEATSASGLCTRITNNYKKYASNDR